MLLFQYLLGLLEFVPTAFLEDASAGMVAKTRNCSLVDTTMRKSAKLVRSYLNLDQNFI